MRRKGNQAKANRGERAVLPLILNLMVELNKMKNTATRMNTYYTHSGTGACIVHSCLALAVAGVVTRIRQDTQLHT